MDKTFIETFRIHLFTLVTDGHITGLTDFKACCIGYENEDLFGRQLLLVLVFV